MSNVPEGTGDAAQAGDAGSQAPAGNVLNEAEKERIRSEEIHSAEERRYREDVRREIRREARGRTTWARVVAMLQLEPGISDEIASDPNSTNQGLLVVAVANAVAYLLLLPIAVVTIPVSIAFIAINAGLYSLLSRLFASEVPEYSHWFRALLYATAPSALGIVPIIGSLVGGIYVVVLNVVVIRDLARITTGAAIVVWLIVLLLALIVIAVAGLWLGLAAFLQQMPTVFNF